MRTQILIIVLLFAVPLAAQAPVQPVPDWASYFTAGVNPTIAAIQAFRSEHPKCELAQLAVSGGLANGGALLLQHFIVSPRPCLGCPPHGMPSAHVASSFIGGAWNPRWAISFTYATAQLRKDANRHTTKQVIAGAVLGGLAELAGQRLVKCS